MKTTVQRTSISYRQRLTRVGFSVLKQSEEIGWGSFYLESGLVTEFSVKSHEPSDATSVHSTKTWIKQNGARLAGSNEVFEVTAISEPFI